VSSLEIAHFKEVVGHFATGVVVVTSITPDGPAGFTSQTFGSLSLEPMLVSFAASNTGQSWSRVHPVGFVAVNVLSDDQETLARVFATSGIDKFDGVAWSAAPHGSPLLEGALAHLEGEILSIASHGDHDIAVVGVDFAVSHAGHPLLYFRGGFGCLA
jgi:3-hydroxy-9,10-secoandrosta-1,3,5(10)-triene-9,17-dione monooxygenase reductase component